MISGKIYSPPLFFLFKIAFSYAFFSIMWTIIITLSILIRNHNDDWFCTEFIDTFYRGYFHNIEVSQCSMYPPLTESFFMSIIKFYSFLHISLSHFFLELVLNILWALIVLPRGSFSHIFSNWPLSVGKKAFSQGYSQGY